MSRVEWSEQSGEWSGVSEWSGVRVEWSESGVE